MNTYEIGRRNIVEELLDAVNEPDWTSSRDSDGVLVRQPPGTIGDRGARFTVGTRETARTSPFDIILTTRGFLVRERRVAAAELVFNKMTPGGSMIYNQSHLLCIYYIGRKT
ncbi:12374_t:CDS:2 [Funneliformis geosporum]|nr:12374_t:CDS:2 [Funneliformis geosporum]